MPESALAGKVALVTGAARRLGREIALTLARQGATLAVHYGDSKAEAETTAHDISSAGGRAEVFRADLAQVDQIAALAESVRSALGPVDILVNNAAAFARTPFGEVSVETWDRLLNVNLRAQFFCAQAVGPAMKQRGGGVIVNLGSAGAIEVWPSFIPYSVAKAGLHHMTRLLARALAPEVRVNAIAPGTVAFGDDDPDAARFARKALLGSAIGPQDIATTALFLCTSAKFVTGEIFVVDGGHSLV